MAWLQENYIIAVVGLVVAVFLLWWLFGRSRPEELAPPTVEPTKPAKPLEPVKPEIVAAEPARFKPLEPKPQPVAPAAPPPAAAAKAPLPKPEPAPAPAPTPAAKAPASKPKAAAKPKAVTPPAAKKAATKEAAPKAAAKPATKAAAKPAAKKAAAKPAPAAAIPAEPTVPPPAAKPAAKKAAAKPAAATADNLQLLKGVGPKLDVLLKGLGVTSFQQVANWTDADITAIDAQLGAFQGRIARDNLVDQAGYLARGDKAGFEAKYGALGSEL